MGQGSGEDPATHMRETILIFMGIFAALVSCLCICISMSQSYERATRAARAHRDSTIHHHGSGLSHRRGMAQAQLPYRRSARRRSHREEFCECASFVCTECWLWAKIGRYGHEREHGRGRGRERERTETFPFICGWPSTSCCGRQCPALQAQLEHTRSPAFAEGILLLMASGFRTIGMLVDNRSAEVEAAAYLAATREAAQPPRVPEETVEGGERPSIEL